MSARLQRLLPFIAPVGATLFLLSGPLLGATTDDEEYRNAIASLVLHARAVLDGEYPFWTSALGFGLPHPLHPTFFFHPLMPFFGLWPVGTAVRVLYALHGGLGAVGAWLLVRHLVPSAWIAGLGSATWVLATPALSYSQTDFWPSNFIGWSLAPFLLLWGLRVLEYPGREQPWGDALALGVTAGFLTVTGHAGQQPSLFLPLAVLCLLQPRRTLHRFPALSVASLLGAVIASPVVARLLIELSYFPDLPRLVVDVPMGWSAAAEILLRPVDRGPFVGIFAETSAHGTHLPFFGGPMLLLALAYIVGFRGASSYRLGLAGAFVVALVMVFLPSDSGPTIVPGTYVFRDPTVLTGTLVGCVTLHAIAQRARWVAFGIGNLQMLTLVLAALPFVAEAWQHGGVSDPSKHHTPITRSLQEWRGRLPGRWYLAPQLDELVRRGSVYDDGLWRDTWVYYDLPVVNGLYKGISVDTIHPSGTLPLGRIDGHASTVRSAPILNLMGIGAVLAMADEPVADSLEEVAKFDTHLGRQIRLLRNPGAWPGAGFVDAALLETRPPNLEECRAGILCLDMSAVDASGPDTRVRVTRAHGVVRAAFARSGAPRRLLVSEMYRPEWTARANGRPLVVGNAWSGLVVVDVPAGVGEVELRYRPTLLLALTWASGVTLLTTALVLVLMWARGRRRRQTSRTGTATPAA